MIIKRFQAYIFIRYIILLIIAVSIGFFYNILIPITTYTSFFLLKIFFKDILINSTTILINKNFFIEIIPACASASAYLLLLILNLSVKMNYKKRIFSLIFSFLLLFAVNILRIILLSIMFVNKMSVFDFTHRLSWYFLSIIFVIVIWFLSVKIFKIKEIPFYSDLKKFKGS